MFKVERVNILENNSILYLTECKKKILHILIGLGVYTVCSRYIVCNNPWLHGRVDMSLILTLHCSALHCTTLHYRASPGSDDHGKWEGGRGQLPYGRLPWFRCSHEAFPILCDRKH